MYKIFSVRILERQSGPSSGPRERSKEKEIIPKGEEIEALNTEVLATLSNKDFLRVARDSRLEHITNPSKKARELTGGDTLNITFRFDGKLNQDLYLRTTAGQVMPENIKTIEAYGTTWMRNGILGEFFNTQGNRLIIRDGTALTVKESISPEELVKQNTELVKLAMSYKDSESYDFILAGLKRNIPPNVVLTLFGKSIETITDPKLRNIEIEDTITEFERIKDYFYDDYKKSVDIHGTLSPEFLAYYINYTNSPIISEVKQNLGITEAMEKNFNRKERARALFGFKQMEELTDEEKIRLKDVPTDILMSWQKESFGKQFLPGSKECQQLFTCAAIFAGLPPEWGSNESLHKILARESNGVVGIANYTLRDKGMDGPYLKAKALEKGNLPGENIAGQVGVTSTASGLGQLTLSNEKFLPHGRNSIGIPLEEAIAMLRYIDDRYGSPTIAGEIYGNTGSYIHAKTGQVLPKQFKEGY